MGHSLDVRRAALNTPLLQQPAEVTLNLALGFSKTVIHPPSAGAISAVRDPSSAPCLALLAIVSSVVRIILYVGDEGKV